MSTAPPAAVPATWPPSLQLLLGSPAAGLLTATLDPPGGRVEDLALTGVALRPDGSATVRYAASVAWADGRRTRESLVAATGSAIPPGAAVVPGGAAGRPVRVATWRWPADPALPGLRWAGSPARCAERLAELGLAAGTPRLRSYRPGRRAVVEVAGPAGHWFLKVVRPAAAAGLARRHALLAPVLPVPPVRAATADGVLVLAALPGIPLRAALTDPAAGLPGPAELEALLDALPAAVAALPARGRRAPAGDPLARLAAHARVLGTVSPGLRPRLDRLGARLAGAVGTHRPVPVHGDFYEAQVLVDRGAVVGLLDMDTAGSGDRADDWATLLGHLVLLEHLRPGAPRVAAYRERVAALLAGRVPEQHLRARVAAVLVGLATGPFRVQQEGWAQATADRLALAEEQAGRR